MQADPQPHNNNHPVPQTGWIERLYRLQVWIYLLVGLLGLLETLPLYLSWGLEVILLFMVLPSLALVLANVIALRRRSSFGWWLHILSILLLCTVILPTINANGPWVDDQTFAALIAGLYLVSFIIALAAKRTLFGNIGVIVPLLAVVIISSASIGALTHTPPNKQPTTPMIAELKPVTEVQGKVIFANPELDQALGSSYHSKISLPDLPGKDYYKSLIDVRQNDTPVTLPDGQFYQVWLTDTARSSYHPILSFFVVDGSVNNIGGREYIEYDHTRLKLEKFPIVLLSKETFSVAQVNADKPSDGREQSKPTNVIFEGMFKEVDSTTQDLFNSIVAEEDRITTTK